MKIVLIKALEQWKLKLLKATFVQQYFPFYIHMKVFRYL